MQNSRTVFTLTLARLLACLLLTACGAPLAPTVTPAPPTIAPLPPSPSAPPPLYRDPAAAAEARAADLLARMTLAEKIGQMTQVEKNSLKPEDVTSRFIGSVLSGGGGSPQPNTAAAWLKMTNDFQAAALKTRLGIPLIYGVDAIHGHGNLAGATIFPQQIGLGATRDADLVRRIGRATAEEVAATGVHWNFAPVVAVPQDIRWGRTYEAYSEDAALVSQLAVAYLQGMQEGAPAILGTPKHYLADGGTAYGSSTAVNMNVKYLLDQGEARVDEAALRAVHLPPYKAAVDAGALSIMASFSSWNGVKVHAQKRLLTDILKNELGFQGFLVSDWQAVDQIPGGYDNAVSAAINAGIDMVMVPTDYNRFIATLTRVIEAEVVPIARIDDAVRRILTVKFRLGLFERPLMDERGLATVGSEAHRQLAREAVRKSLVLLKNEQTALPLAKNTSTIFVAGQAADDIGIQCGGWTIEWQGKAGPITPGTTILAGLRAAATGRVEFNADAKFDGQADIGIAVVGERPYAEGVGDRASLSLSAADITVIQRLRERSKKLVIVLISGRPLIVTEQLAAADAFVAAWLPGTEGAGVADVLFGDHPFTGKLPFAWPRANDRLPRDPAPLFPIGFGLEK